MQSDENRIVLLLGAGAIVPWDAPKTKDLTKIISDYIPDNDTFQTKNGKPVGEYLINSLNKYYKEKDLVNFETLIDIIESIYNYYDLIEREGGENLSIKSYIPAIFQIKKEIEEIYSFSDYDVIYNESYGENNLKRIYLIKIFKEYLSIIKEEVIKYSNNFDNDNYNKINSDLRNFISALTENNHNTIRAYTLNYDNFLPKVCKDFNFFNGFNDKEKIKHSSSLADDYLGCSHPDINSIVKNRACNSYFNLHGSVFFKKNSLDEKFLYCSLTNDFKSSIGRGDKNYMNEANSGEYILHAPIVTGFKKVQRTLIEPLRAFQVSFYLDLLEADKIFIIGYSFSDPYINNLLISNKEKKEIICVDYIDEVENPIIDNHPSFNKFVHFFNDSSFVYEKNLSWITFNGKSYKYYYKGFEEFLKDRGAQ